MDRHRPSALSAVGDGDGEVNDCVSEPHDILGSAHGVVDEVHYSVIYELMAVYASNRRPLHPSEVCGPVPLATKALPTSAASRKSSRSRPWRRVRLTEPYIRILLIALARAMPV